MKLVTVIIPTFNRPEATLRAINSVFTIQPDSVHIVVVDDAGERRIDSSITRNRYGVTVEHHNLTVNVGPGKARSIGVEISQTPYVMFLDSDDIFTNDWVDYIISTLQCEARHHQTFFITGHVGNERATSRYIRSFIATRSFTMQRIFSRFTVPFFNLFYIQASAFSKDICQFHNNFRFCEDYYTNGLAVMTADNVIVLNKEVCILSREPSSIGGLSANQKNMFKGELAVRYSFIYNTQFRTIYKLLLPMGFLYQFVRTAAKSSLRFIR